MHLSIVTPEGSFFEGEVESVQLPAFDGELGVLKDHAPLLTELGAGELIAATSGGQKKIVLSGGYLQVLNNRVTVLATQAYEPGSIDFDRIQKDLETAQNITPQNDNEFEEKEKALSRAQKILSLK